MSSEHELCRRGWLTRRGSVKIMSLANLGLASADSRGMADVLGVRGEGFDREQVLPKCWPNELERGEQFRKLGRKSL